MEAACSTDRKEHKSAHSDSWSAIHKIEQKLGCGTGNVDQVIFYITALGATITGSLP